MADLASFKATVYGGVQRVFFRASTKEQAVALGLTGYVCNLPDGNSVKVEAEGEKIKLEELIRFLEVGPPRSRVDKVDVEWADYGGIYPDFSVRY
jgi:acylphosphatase